MAGRDITTKKVANDLIEALANAAYAGAVKAGEFILSAVQEKIEKHKKEKDS